MTGAWLRVIVAGLLLAHGVAHVPGFAVSWRLLTSPDLPYHTTLLGGRVDVGVNGIRLVGLLWLVCGASFLAAAASWWAGGPSASLIVGGVALGSLLLCLLEYQFASTGLLLNVAILVALPVLASSQWTRATDIMIRRMTGSGAGSAKESTADHPLPTIVARYLARAVDRPDTVIRSVAITQEAEFSLGDHWYPAPARQFISASQVAYVWDARIAVAPLLSVFVRDSYEQGVATMHARFLGVYPITFQRGITELNAGALHRYLAEAVWNPSALRPSSSIRWEPIDDGSARVTMTDRGTTVSLEFRFTPQGDVAEIFTPARFAESRGRYELRPWRIICSDYAAFDGVRIPARCEVAWVSPSGPEPYWRGRVTSATYTR